MLTPTLTKRRDVRGRRVLAHVATFGPLSAEGSDPKAATQSLSQSLTAAVDRLSAGTYIGQWAGHTFVVSPDPYGWVYWIDTFSRTDYQPSAGRTRELAIHSALTHLGQQVWTPETDDRAFLLSLPIATRRDFASWIGFQRAFIRERLAGTPEPLIHRQACERPEYVEVPTDAR